jgi:shikimate kinase
MDNIILIGMPGSGKSSVGIVLAKMLGFHFLDVDLLIQERESALLQELIDQRGVSAFLDAERDAICSLDCHHTVIAPGGSCVCREESIEKMCSLGRVLYLKLSLSEVESRIHDLATRGIAMAPGQTIADVYAYRTPLYERCAQVTISADGQSLADTVEAIKVQLFGENNNISGKSDKGCNKHDIS